MKMSKELYTEIKQAIDGVVEQHGIDRVKEHRRSVKFAINQFISFCWSMFHASNFEYRKCYDEKLDDVHIETALKRILSDYK